MEAMFDPGMETQIAEWRSYLLRRRTLHHVDIDELEDHLRSEMSALAAAGLSDDESFLVATRRLGGANELAREFARERSSQLWKQLALADAPPGVASAYGGILVTIGVAVAAAAAFKIPAVFGLDPFAHLDDGKGEAAASFYLRNAALLTLPFLLGFLGWRRGLSRRTILALAVPFVLAAVLINALPFRPGGDTERLAAFHLPLVLWLVLGVAYLGGAWRGDAPWMEFVRFTGEWLIYYTLIALGGGVLVLLTAGVFTAIHINIGPVIGAWLLPCGAVGAIIVVAWLVEAKQSVIENMAPVLTGVFTPLFALMLVTAIAGMVITGRVIDAGRDLLIVIDLLLVLVVGLVLYSLSARDPDARPTPMDAVQLVLVAAALVIDVLALAAMLARITEFGFTPNRTAGLGLNVVLLANLVRTAWLLAAFLRGRRPFADIERWQTAYVPVYGAWAVVVLLAFPPLFAFA